MSKTERLIYFYDLKPSAGSRGFDQPTPLTAKRSFELMDLVPLDQRSLARSKNTQTVYVTAWETDGTIIKMLLNKSDKSIPDPVFSVPATSRRTAQKNGNEGQDYSAHIVVKLPSEANSPALMLIEKCPGLNAVIVGQLFRRILKIAKTLSPQDYLQNHPDGSVDSEGRPKTYAIYPGFSIDGHISPDFANDLNRGKMRSVELITHQKLNAPFDSTGYLSEHTSTVKLTVNPNGGVIANVAAHLVSIIQRNNNIYKEAKIKFTSPNSELERTVLLDSDGLAENYVKKELIDGFSVLLEGSYDQFQPEILAKITNLAGQASNA